MSDILIKGVEMPKNCYECLVRNQGFSGDGMKCGKTGSVLSWRDGHRKRMDNCPLSPVPAHGRLIDADALKVKAIERSEKCGMCVNVLDKVITAYDIETAPTIIPEDKED